MAAGLTGARALADEVIADQKTQAGQAQPVSILDNLYLDTGVGAEKPPGEDSTLFGSVGANWGIPLTPPDGVAWGLQLGGSLKARDDDPELNGTFGGFARNFRTFQDQQGAFAALLDYRRTAFHNDLWAFRPIVGTTVTPQDALGVEGGASLNESHDQRIMNALTTFWTRGWSEIFGTEFGAGYEFGHGALLRARAAIALTRKLDWWIGGDASGRCNYAMGTGVSYHFGGTAWHASLHNVGGSGSGLYTPFPDADFPSLLHRTR